jgi:hypothetical protein
VQVGAHEAETVNITTYLEEFCHKKGYDSQPVENVLNKTRKRTKDETE